MNRPVYKSGVKHEITNYRPILWILIITKGYDKIIHNRIYDFITKNKILTTDQYDFINQRGP